jgi:subtilisin-like proprotein convertase family protein
VPIPTDPLLSQQWHLGNSGGLLDLNVRAVWNPASGAAYTGAGTRVVVIDNGFDYLHSDLAPNYDTFLDFDFENNTSDAFGSASEAHGTAVAGIIGADNNGTGAVGIAFDTSLVGYRTANFISDAWLQDIRDAIHHAAMSAQGDVANISQGIANDANSEFGVGYNAARFDEIETSIGTAVNQGRGGLGMTIVKSAGNSRADNYDVNADDWTNDTRQVVVAAVDQNGFVSSYSSYGSALLISGFGTPGEVVTTDRTGAAGYTAGNFTTTFNGTSAAAPMVAGVVSLIYDANPDLGWRDVQSILAYSARHVGSSVGSGPAGSERYLWQFNDAQTWNGGGLHFSNDYGYGLVDALAAVRLAETWLNGSAAQVTSNEFSNIIDMLNGSVVIPDGNATGMTFTGNAAFDDVVERVTVTVTFSTTFTADMEIYVTSPGGTTSELIDDTGGSTDFNGTWTFESQAFRGERAAGTWSVLIVDDAGADVLTVSDIVVRTFGGFSADDRYVYTNEYSNYDGLFGHSTTIVDTNGGIDTLNAAAVTSNSTIKLKSGIASIIDGVTTFIAAGTTIENAIGGDGHDTISGNGAANDLYGGRGNDTIYGSNGADDMFGGAGFDTANYRYSTAVTIDLAAGTGSGGHAQGDTLSGFEKVVGSKFNDSLFGNGAANSFNGGAGNDTLRGGGGKDWLAGGADEDTFVYMDGFGVDTAADYQPGLDEFDLTGVSGLNNYFDVRLLMIQSGANVVIDFGGGNKLVIKNTTLATLDANQGDFVV